MTPTIRHGATFAPFVIYTAGRSRTAWLSQFLTYGDCRCHFEMASQWRNLSDAGKFFSRPTVGTAETAIAAGWKLLDHYFPCHRKVVVRRSATEIIASLKAAVGGRVEFDEQAVLRSVIYALRCLDQISERPETLTVDFDDLKDERSCEAIFKHCLPYRFDRNRWLDLKDRNVQADVVEFARNLDVQGVQSFQRACRREFYLLARRGHLRK